MSLPQPYYEDEAVTIYHGDFRKIVPQISKVDLLLTDPPYCKIKGDFDQAWANKREFLETAREWVEVFYDAIKSNGTLYWFAWPHLAGRLESLISEHFNPLAHIVWKKPNAFLKHSRDTLRAPVPETERILMAEHYGADNKALGESGYLAQCDELRGFVFEPLRAYLDGERERAKISRKEIDKAWQKWKGNKGGMSSHWFTQSQWVLPTRENYEWLRSVFAGDYLRREYEDLRREYEDLRREYEDLRRYFKLEDGDPKSEIWHFGADQERLGHPTPKPLDLISFMIRISSRKNGTILDPFLGSGTTLRAAKDLGRKAIGIEIEERYCEIAAKRMQQEVFDLGGV